jgi:G3E family GTPase
MNAYPGPPIPVFLVTGFLGSGKTTLISALLKQPAMKGTAVVVNELGAVGIDDAIFAEDLEPENVLLLANGCLCCTAGDDLVKTVWSLVGRQGDRPSRVVIETTGLADPVPALLRLMADPRLNLITRLGGVIATVDAINGPNNLDGQRVALRQAAIADRRIVTKADLTDSLGVAALIERLTTLNPGSPVHVVSHGAIEAGELFDGALFDPFAGRADPDSWMRIEAFGGGPVHGRHQNRVLSDMFVAEGVVATWLVEEARPVDWTILSPRLGAIIGRYGDVLLRLKGIVHTTDDPRPLVFHGVQRLFHPPVRIVRSAAEKRSSIVVIGERRAEVAVAAIGEALAEAASDAQR